MANKSDSLKENGCFNSNHGNVTAGLFGTSAFFDKRDVVQVKYEMVRAASNGEGSISEIAAAHGFSRKSCYQASRAFESGGLHALVPKKTGPKGPIKLNAEVLEFIGMFVSENKGAKAGEVSVALEAAKGIKIHPRTIHRYLKKN